MARLINCFEVRPGRDEEFVAMFREMNAYMAARPGFLGNRLHRSLAPEARYRFVNYVEWESPAHLRAARDEHFDELRAGILAAGFTSTSSLDEIVQERPGGDGPVAESTSAGLGGTDDQPGGVTAGQRPDTHRRR